MVSRARTAFLVVAVQTAATLLTSIIGFSLAGERAALSAATGGGICVVATALFSIRVLLGRPEWSPERFLGRFFLAEIQKIVLMALLLLAALKWLDVDGLPLMLAFLAAVVANWLVLLIDI